MEDELIVTYDYCPPDVPTLIVARKDKFDITILNKIQGDKAKELHDYLVNHREKCCQTCKFCIKHQYICTHPKHVGDYVQKYTVCNDWI